jgi:hypothetical protein
MLRTSTRNVAYEVISCLIDNNGNGVLTEIIKLLTTMNKNFVSETGSSFLDGSLRKKNPYGKHYNLNGIKDASHTFYRGAKLGDSEEETESFDNHNLSPFVIKK